MFHLTTTSWGKTPPEFSSQIQSLGRWPNKIVCGLREPRSLAGLPAMTTDTNCFYFSTRYQLRNADLLVSTYLCLQKLTPMIRFPNELHEDRFYHQNMSVIRLYSCFLSSRTWHILIHEYLVYYYFYSQQFIKRTKIFMPVSSVPNNLFSGRGSD